MYVIYADFILFIYLFCAYSVYLRCHYSVYLFIPFVIHLERHQSIASSAQHLYDLVTRRPMRGLLFRLSWVALRDCAERLVRMVPVKLHTMTTEFLRSMPDKDIATCTLANKVISPAGSLVQITIFLQQHFDRRNVCLWLVGRLRIILVTNYLLFDWYNGINSYDSPWNLACTAILLSSDL